jgi:hypothetical protein
MTKTARSFGWTEFFASASFGSAFIPAPDRPRGLGSQVVSTAITHFECHTIASGLFKLKASRAAL